jgi:hypothetical protein
LMSGEGCQVERGLKYMAFPCFCLFCGVQELNENVQLPVNSMRIVSNNLLGNDSDDSDEDEPTDSVHQPRTLRWQPPTRLRTNDSSKVPCPWSPELASSFHP